MNSLSLLIYAVELITNIGWWTTFCLGVFPILMIVTLVVWAFSTEEAERRQNTAEVIAARTASARYWRNWWIAGFIVAAILNTVVPSRQTTIMIAASEVAEIVVKSEQAQSVMKDVTGLGADAVGLLKTYIQSEQTKLMDEIKAMTKPKEEPKKEKANEPSDKA